jgi:DNA-binding CsgD family transcriptional regulator
MATPTTINVLTPLQYEILKRMVEGASRFDIGKVFDISHKTAEYHRAAIFKKLELSTMPQLTMWALAMGIVENPFRNETPELTSDALQGGRFKKDLKKEPPKPVEVKVPEQEQSASSILIFKPRIPERERSAPLAPKKRGGLKGPPRTNRDYVHSLAGPVNAEDDLWCEFNPNSFAFETKV